MKQNFDKLPEEIRDSRRFFPLTADGKPAIADWQNPENQRHYTEIGGLAGFDCNGHGAGDDYCLIVFKNVLRDDGSFANVDCESMLQLAICTLDDNGEGVYTERSANGRDIVLILKPTPNKFGKIDSDKNTRAFLGTEHVEGVSPAMHVFYLAAKKYWIPTGDKFYDNAYYCHIYEGAVADNFLEYWIDIIHSVNEMPADDAPAETAADTTASKESVSEADNDGGDNFTPEARVAMAQRQLDTLYANVTTNGAGKWTYLWLKQQDHNGSLTIPFDVSTAEGRLQMAQRAIEMNDKGYQAYFGVNLMATPADNGKRANSDTIVAQVAVVTDIDIESAWHVSNTRKAYPANIEVAKSFLPAEPSMIIDSGGGIHGYVIFDKPVHTPDAGENGDAYKRNVRYLDCIRRKAGKCAGAVDAVHDLPRVLRVAGTYNLKHGRHNAPMAKIFSISDKRFTADEIDSLISTTQADCGEPDIFSANAGKSFGDYHSLTPFQFPSAATKPAAVATPADSDSAVNKIIRDTVKYAQSENCSDGDLRDLFAGNIDEYAKRHPDANCKSQSECDYACMKKILWYVGSLGDDKLIRKAAIETFSQSELAQRDKWQQRPDYQDKTFAAAFQSWAERGRKSKNNKVAQDNTARHDSSLTAEQRAFIFSGDLTDYANARRLVCRFGDNLKYISDVDKFATYEFSQWKIAEFQKDSTVLPIVSKFVRIIEPIAQKSAAIAEAAQKDLDALKEMKAKLSLSSGMSSLVYECNGSNKKQSAENIEGAAIETSDTPRDETPTETGDASRDAQAEALDEKQGAVSAEKPAETIEGAAIEANDTSRDKAPSAAPKETVQSINKKIEAQEKDAARKTAIATYQGNVVKKFKNRTSAVNAITMLKGFEEVRITMKDFDANPMLLNVANGVIDLESGRLMQHSPELLMTKQCRAVYRPGYHSAIFDDFMTSILEDDTTRGAVLRFLGYALTGDVREEKALFVKGCGRNGKGSLFTAIMTALDSYATPIKIDALLQRKFDKDGDAPTPEFAKLEGRRLVVANEIPQGRQLDVAHFKDLTGGDKVPIRRLHCESSTIENPTHKLILCGQHLPNLDDARDIGLKERLLVVVFPKSFTGENCDPSLKRRLQSADALSGLLTTLVEECLLWQREGLIVSTAMKEAKKEYLEANDFIAQFVLENCEYGAGLSVTFKEFVKRIREQYDTARRLSDVALRKAIDKYFGLDLPANERPADRQVVKSRQKKGMEFSGIGWLDRAEEQTVLQGFE